MIYLLTFPHSLCDEICFANNAKWENQVNNLIPVWVSILMWMKAMVFLKNLGRNDWCWSFCIFVHLITWWKAEVAPAVPGYLSSQWISISEFCLVLMTKSRKILFKLSYMLLCCINDFGSSLFFLSRDTDIILGMQNCLMIP